VPALNHLNSQDVDPWIRELICYISLARLDSEAEKKNVQTLAKNIQDWTSFFDLVEFNAVGVIAYCRLHDLRGTGLGFLFESRMEILNQRIEPALDRSKKQLQMLPQILDEMSKRGIEVIVLKGALLAFTLYDHPVYKKMNDLDLLVKFDQAPQAAEVLRDLGFQRLDSIFVKTEFSEQTHHSPPYIHWDHQCVVGLHWGLHSKRLPWRINTEEVWERKVPCTLNGAPAYRMSWEDNLLHLCIHLPFYKTGLRELADIFNLARYCNPGINWDSVLVRAKEWNAYDPVYRSLTLAHALVPLHQNASVLDRVFRELRPFCARFCLSETHRRAGSIERLLRSRSTYVAKIEKSCLVFRCSDNYLEKTSAWFKTWSLTFLPPPSEIVRIGFITSKNPIALFLVGRFWVPFLILRALAKEHGVLGLIWITLDNIRIQWVNTVTLSFLKRSPRLRQSKFGKLLEVLE